ncbi:unnamed protein product [Spirodela intermedia]|uniref:RWP-RK domain-containing protein n=1 Tax=Spirodela intermedia TaxID=51605 RepID=A0A7I8J0D1_SPIIN|nr:unnamed protein product [Spirodela intermedia]CAA6662760.1 unnamed protein product [Spirodela intermedia]
MDAILRGDCSRCHILRDVFMQGHEAFPHGFLGGVHHAILIIQHIADHVVEHKYIADLRLLDAKSLKEFLVNHTYRCFEDGLTLVQDKYQTFYEVLSIKMDYPEDYRIPTSKEERASNPKTGVAGQRERIKQLTYTDISQYFHLPATEAAQKLRICSTALKKVSRKFNLNRWPHRKQLPCGACVSRSGFGSWSVSP